jgi:hypothetical protein
VRRQCLFCESDGRIALGIRARYENTNAVWAPNLDAYLCEQHASDGCLIELEITARTDGKVTTIVHGPRGRIATALVIGAGVKVSPGQTALL